MEKQKPWQNFSSSKLYIPCVVFACGFSSLSGVFVNKACLSGYGFEYPITLMVMQLMVSVALTNVLRWFKILEITTKPFKELLFLFIPATTLILNVTVGLYALKLVNIPMFSAFRRLSAINVMILEYFVLGKVESLKIVGTVLFMVFGSFVAAMGDLTFDMLGYVLVFLNNFITGGNLVYIKKAQQVTGLQALSLFYHISLFALPLCALLAILSGEIFLAYEHFISTPSLHTSGFLFAISMSALSAFLINYTTNLCTQVTSALTTAITGQTKNILQTVLGLFTSDYKGSALNLIGLFLALIASILFGWVKHLERSWYTTEKKQQPDEKIETTVEQPLRSSSRASTPRESDLETDGPKRVT